MDPNQVVQPVGGLVVRDPIGGAMVIARQIDNITGVGLLSAFGPASNGQVADIFGS